MYIPPERRRRPFPSGVPVTKMSGGLMQDTNGIDFIGQNLIAIGVIGLLMFVYLLFLVRKRWRKGFLHDEEKKHK